MRSLLRVFLLFAIFFLPAAPAGAQSNPSSKGNPLATTAEAAPAPEPQFQPRTREEDRFKIEHEREMARQRNKERQAALKKDTDKLLQLAKELKEYVDKTDENMLSVEVLKKAAEIEKLSKSVQEKMKAEAYYPPVGSVRTDPQ